MPEPPLFIFGDHVDPRDAAPSEIDTADAASARNEPATRAVPGGRAIREKPDAKTMGRPQSV